MILAPVLELNPSFIQLIYALALSLSHFPIYTLTCSTTRLSN